MHREARRRLAESGQTRQRVETREKPGDSSKFTIVLGVPHCLTNTATMMLRNMGGRPNHWNFPLCEKRYPNSFTSPWRVLIFCEPLSVVVAYEQRRGVLYGIPDSPDPAMWREPIVAFRENWLALYAWVEDARARDVFPKRSHVICMDRTGYPPRVGVFDFEADMIDVKEMIASRDVDGLLRDARIAPYVHWMRERREIFEFVDQVGSYGSAWWLDD